MASGAIIGQCPFCGDWIWESDDWEIHGKFMHHAGCHGNKPLFEFLKLPLEKQIKMLNEAGITIKHG